ncbi:MAG: hypothetical protein KDD47_28165, partial [Acidobacteria bacterium]|nr:hypothetical protein [Acidobacteriota bacterium]
MPEEELKTLLPASEKRDRHHLKRIAQLWKTEGEDAASSVLEHIYQPRAVFRISPDEGRWDFPLASLPWPLYGVGRRDEVEGQIYPVVFHFWVGTEARVDLRAIGESADRAFEWMRQKTLAGEKGIEDRQFVVSPLRVVVTGPGVEASKSDPTRRVAVLRSREYLQAAWEGDLAENLLRRARAQMRLTASSPFQLSGPLPPGSPIFFGREGELTLLKAHARRISTLILGSRRVGKTSLLNQVLHWARGQEDLAPIYVDLQ